MVARIQRLHRYVTSRIWPLLAGFGSAMVMPLAFFIPSDQDSLAMAGQELREAAKLAPDDITATACLRELGDTMARWSR